MQCFRQLDKGGDGLPQPEKSMLPSVTTTPPKNKKKFNSVSRGVSIICLWVHSDKKVAPPSSTSICRNLDIIFSNTEFLISLTMNIKCSGSTGKHMNREYWTSPLYNLIGHLTCYVCILFVYYQYSAIGHVCMLGKQDNFFSPSLFILFVLVATLQGSLLQHMRLYLHCKKIKESVLNILKGNVMQPYRFGSIVYTFAQCTGFSWSMMHWYNLVKQILVKFPGNFRLWCLAVSKLPPHITQHTNSCNCPMYVDLFIITLTCFQVHK